MIRFRGQNIVDTSPEKIARLGLSLVPEGRHIFGSLTVEENLLIGASRRGDRREAAKDFTRVYDYFAPLRERRANPQVVCRVANNRCWQCAGADDASADDSADEPSLGLAPKIIDQIYRILLDLRVQEKLTLLINEQSSHRIVKQADRIYVLRAGEIRLHGAASELGDGRLSKRRILAFTTNRRLPPRR